MRRVRITHPLRLDPEEDPHPPPADLQHLHQEDARLEVREVVQVRTQFQAPGAAQQEVEHDGGVVHGRREDGVGAEAVWVVMGLRCAAVLGAGLGDGGEEGEIPVFPYVPVEAVEGVECHGEYPHSV